MHIYNITNFQHKRINPIIYMYSKNPAIRTPSELDKKSGFLKIPDFWESGFQGVIVHLFRYMSEITPSLFIYIL